MASETRICGCGGVVKATSYRVAEDCCGARATCGSCGKYSAEIEDVWGDYNARMQALYQWDAGDFEEWEKGRPVREGRACSDCLTETTELKNGTCATCIALYESLANETFEPA